MDEEEIYNKLGGRIREVFDNYDDDTPADEGWALLRQKFPEEEKRRGLAWLWYAAAAIVLLCLGVWFIYQTGNTQKLMVKNPSPAVKHPANNNSVSDTNSVTNAIAGNRPKPAHIQDTAQTMVQYPAVAQTANNSKKINRSAKAIQHANGLQTASPLMAIAKAPKSVPQNQQQVAINPLANTAVNAVNPANANGNNPVINKNTQADVLANNTPLIKKPDTVANLNDQYVAANKPDATTQPKSADAITKLLSEKTPANKLNDKGKAANNKALINIFAATYFNYAKGSENKINVGAGFGSDFRLSKKLKLSTGVSIAQNSLNYTGGAPDYSGGSRSTGLAAPADPASAALTTVAYNTAGKNGLVSAVTPVLQNYSASLIGLDVPVNLKYQFNPDKNDTYISAGLSSGTFINETYVLNYTSAQLAQKSTTHASFNNFDFAKTLNVSFGMGYPLGKSNQLIIEPFLKYPLDGLGSQQIKFGAGGVNLKLNFVPAKK